MAFKIKKSIIQGTSGHKSALKQMDTDMVKVYSGAKQSEVDAKKKAEDAKGKATEALTGLAQGGLAAAGAAKAGKKAGASPAKQKGKIVYKNGKKYYQASDGSLHTGQVEDYERELAEDKKMLEEMKKKKAKKAKDKPVKPTDRDMKKYSDYEKYDEDGNKITRKQKREVRKEYKKAKKAGAPGT